MSLAINNTLGDIQHYICNAWISKCILLLIWTFDIDFSNEEHISLKELYIFLQFPPRCGNDCNIRFIWLIGSMELNEIQFRCYSSLINFSFFSFLLKRICDCKHKNEFIVRNHWRIIILLIWTNKRHSRIAQNLKQRELCSTWSFST